MHSQPLQLACERAFPIFAWLQLRLANDRNEKRWTSEALRFDTASLSQDCAVRIPREINDCLLSSNFENVRLIVINLQLHCDNNGLRRRGQFRVWEWRRATQPWKKWNGFNLVDWARIRAMGGGRRAGKYLPRRRGPVRRGGIPDIRAIRWILRAIQGHRAPDRVTSSAPNC